MNSIVRIFNYRFYLKEILILFFCYFFIEGIFSWLFLPHSGIENAYEKLLSIAVFGFMIFYFHQLKLVEKVYVGLFTLLIIKLVFESVIFHDSFFKQFTLYTVIYPVIFTFFIKHLLRHYNIDLLEFVAKFYLLVYTAFMIIYGSTFSFSLDQIEMEDYGPFSGDTRIIHARSIYMIVIPFLWFIHQYIKTRKIRHLFPLGFCILIIVLHQHRSVWSSTLFATFIYGLLLIRNNLSHIKGIVRILVISIIATGILTFYLLNLMPEVVDFFAMRFLEIFDPAKEGSTGNFRIEQAAIYNEFILQRPIIGWSFEGFALRNPYVDWWEENTGHHFHQGYIEILFYHGIFGLLLKYSILGVILFKAITTKLRDEAIVLSAFCISGLIFSLNYVLPLIFWGHAGMCLYYIELQSAQNDLYRNSRI